MFEGTNTPTNTQDYDLPTSPLDEGVTYDAQVRFNGRIHVQIPGIEGGNRAYGHVIDFDTADVDPNIVTLLRDGVAPLTSHATATRAYFPCEVTRTGTTFSLRVPALLDTDLQSL